MGGYPEVTGGIIAYDTSTIRTILQTPSAFIRGTSPLTPPAFVPILVHLLTWVFALSCPAFGVKSMSPRVKHAARLYALGLVKTQKDAANAVGLAPYYLNQLFNGNDMVQSFAKELDDRLANEAIQASAILQIAGRRAISNIAHLMEDQGVKDDIRLKAAIDLADRSPEMQKVQRVDVSGLSIGEGDARAIASALLESAQERQRYAKVATDGLIGIEPETRDLPVRALTGGTANDRQPSVGDTGVSTATDGPAAAADPSVTSITEWLAAKASVPASTPSSV